MDIKQPIVTFKTGSLLEVMTQRIGLYFMKGEKLPSTELLIPNLGQFQMEKITLDILEFCKKETTVWAKEPVEVVLHIFALQVFSSYSSVFDVQIGFELYGELLR